MMTEKDVLQTLSDYSIFFTEAQEEFNSWISEVAKASNCEDPAEFSAEMFEKLTKEEMSKLVFSAYQDISIFLKETDNMMRHVEELKLCLIPSHTSFVELQGDLIEAKSEQMESDRTTVESDVQDTVKAENMLVFGLNETGVENLCDKVDDLFQQIEIKPRFEGVRFEKKSADRTRLIKISFGNSNTVIRY